MLTYSEDVCRRLAREHHLAWRAKNGGSGVFLKKIVPEIETLRKGTRRVTIRTQQDVIALLSWGCTLRVCANVKHKPHVWHPFFRTGAYPLVPDRTARAVVRRREVVLLRHERLDPDEAKSLTREYGFRI